MNLNNLIERVNGFKKNNEDFEFLSLKKRFEDVEKSFKEDLIKLKELSKDEQIKEREEINIKYKLILNKINKEIDYYLQ